MAVSGIKLKTLPSVTVSVAGSAKPLSTQSLLVYEALVIALDGGTHYIGDCTVTSSNGAPFTEDGDYAIEPPMARGVEQFDISKIYVNSTSAGAEFRVLCWIRE